METTTVVLLSVALAFLFGSGYVLWFFWRVIRDAYRTLFPSKKDLAQKAAVEAVAEAAAEKERQELESENLKALIEKMDRDSKAREFRVARSLGFNNAQEARAADRDGFDALIDQEMERDGKRELAKFKDDLVGQVVANNAAMDAAETPEAHELRQLRIDLDKARRGVKPSDDVLDDLVGHVVKDSPFLKGFLGRRL